MRRQSLQRPFEVSRGGDVFRFIIRLLISGAVIFGVSYLSGGSLLVVESFGWAVALAFVLGIINAVIKPIIQLLAFPVTVITLGLFAVLINAAMLSLAAAVLPGHVQTMGFWPTVLASVIISVITSIATKSMESDE